MSGERSRVSEEDGASAAADVYKRQEFIEKLQLRSGHAASAHHMGEHRPKVGFQEVKKEQKPKKAAKGAKGEGKGKGNSKAKGGKPSLPNGVVLATQFQGKQICYGYNNGRTCKSDCTRAYVCQICFAKHAWPACPTMSKA